MTKDERLMRQRGKRLMKTLKKKSMWAEAVALLDKNSRANDEGETIPPYMTAPPEWYDNETEFIVEARGAGRKNDGMD